jgi:hypothetical protein
MAVLLGNAYLAWFEGATAGTYTVLKGQGTYSETRSQPKIDTSDKTTTGYSTGAYGNTDYEGSLDLRVNLPDTTYTRVESMALSQTPMNFQIRKNGVAGTTTDAIFSALVNVSIGSRSFNKDGTVDVKITVSLAAAPTVDALA